MKVMSLEILFEVIFKRHWKKPYIFTNKMPDLGNMTHCFCTLQQQNFKAACFCIHDPFIPSIYEVPSTLLYLFSKIHSLNYQTMNKSNYM